MKKRVSMMAAACFGVVALVGAVSAKTVALWPIEPDLRCMVDTRLEQSTAAKTEFRTAGALPWELPPNPDADRHLIEIPNQYALWSTNNSAKSMIYSDDRGLAKALSSTSDFTLEGWINVQQIPDNNGWYIIANVNGGSGGAGGWIWSMRRQSRSQYHTDFELYVREGLGDTCLGGKWFEDPTDLTNTWLHVAMVHVWKNAQGQSEWNMYTNGVLYATLTHAAQAEITPGGNGGLQLGGRNSSESNRFRGGLDYWRVSDRALAPEEFLCAGGEGHAMPSNATPTAYYWKLDRRPDGTVDGTPQIGRLPLSGGLPTAGTASTGRFFPSPDQAFAGNPPNTTVTLPGGNNGCFYAPAGGNYWLFDHLGEELEIDRDFTVEGWFKPERNVDDGTSVQYLFNTRMLSGGWALGLQRPIKDQHTWRLQLYAGFSDNTTLVGNYDMSPDFLDWTDWKHVALAYDHAAGNGKGVWTCYVDGVFSGATTNSLDRGEMTSGSRYFHIAGRKETQTTFHGFVDCVRVSRGALDPRQLLCTAIDSQAVPDADVLAFWPLDAKRGTYICGDDLMGNYSFQPAADWTNARMAGTTTDAPTIANPDASPNFSGSPTNLAGSAAFNTSANGNAASSTLLLYNDMADQFFKIASGGWTAECYVKRSAGTPSNWELIFGVANTVTLDGAGMYLNFTYRSNGFCLHDKMNCDLSDNAFSATSGSDIPEGRWAHVALTFQVDGTDGVYEVFVDGVSKGTLRKVRTPQNKGNVFMVGGRPSSGNSFKGNISSVRLSSRVLAPSEFLCGTPETPDETKRTVAYWPLDFDGTTTDLKSRVATGAVFKEVEGVQGTTDKAVARVPRGDASEDFAGDDPRANAGSVVLTGASSRLAVPTLGLRADVGRAFTVEGWFKWSHAASLNENEIVCGTYHPSACKGWKLYLDTTGAKPCVRLYALPTFQYSPLVNGAVLLEDASDWAGAWRHLALTYAPRLGKTGIWTLWVDGKVAGTAENLWAPQGVAGKEDFFALGMVPSGDTTYPFSTAVGGYDMWRLSEGALTADEFLYTNPNGTLVVVR